MLIPFITAGVVLQERKNCRAAVDTVYAKKAIAIKCPLIFLALAVVQYVDKTGVWFSIAMLVDQSNTDPMSSYGTA
ncbi:hypothetical protein UF78_22300 [Stutzerimonas stutzeri]|uniref:Uncharacterized protein n=1 Tax=Stutzerimonas stutzeri TaxID=316 RepID=A0A0D9AEN7_STUST|nr:hypothetical protein UF78_22300 [Stutzerimonas stutzeri]